MIKLGLSVLMIIGIWLIVFSLFMLIKHLILISKDNKQEMWITYVHCMINAIGIVLVYFTLRALGGI
jgi:hypothetical protein